MVPERRIALEAGFPEHFLDLHREKNGAIKIQKKIYENIICLY